MWYSKARVLQQGRQCSYKYIVARSHNHCCRGRTRLITYSKCASVALVIQHAKCMRRITLTSAACLALSCLYTLPPKQHDFWRRRRDNIVNVDRSSSKVFVFLVKFYRNFNFLSRFSKDTHISNFVNIRTVGAELFDADRWTDRQTDKQK
jgi:hypothetical protein